ncbi:MAG: Si-specific NAD(P)(+) transhydrogenase [Phycisphaerales bacterium]|nr:Si-specific NAD(P)(+) transhydrogenase [Phycisphaerales bacterium]
MRQCDLCVIGSGPAGQRAAIQAAKLGKSVVLVERRDVIGGVAVNTGTIPSKALREAILSMVHRQSAMPQVDDFRKAREYGFRELVKSADRVVDAEIDIVQRHMRSNGVVVLHGVARFEDPHVVVVEGAYATERIQAEHVLVATGTEPAKPDNIAFDEQTIITSDEILRLPTLPHSMIIVGGGVIGTEYASMLSVLGVKVTLIEGRPRILEFVDGEIGEALQYHLRQEGMTLRLGEKVVKISRIEATPGARTMDNAMAEAMLESGKTVRADSLLYAIGRQGATAELALDRAGLTADSRGRLKVNEHFQTDVGHIYAAGDVIGFPALASTSMEQGRSAACHMFGKHVDPVSRLLPYGIYAIPELSMVGWTEERLTEEGIPFESGVAQYREIARGQLLGDDIGMLKLLIHQESHAILGVHVIGTGATELVHIGQCAMAFGATVEYFVNAVFNYPTLAECYKTAALNGLNKLRGV